jgi:ketosteroid isomerase-like protein
MKYCPTCHASYADESLQFCLEDGTRLAIYENQVADIPTVVLGEQETVLRGGSQYSQSADWGQSQAAQTAPPPKGSNTLVAILLTVLIMLVVFGLAGIGVWAYFSNLKNERAQNDPAPVNSNYDPGLPPPTSSVKSFPTPNSTLNTNSTPLVMVTPADLEQVKNEVSDRIYTWKSYTESRDLEACMSQYADTVDYYHFGKRPLRFLRGDKQRRFKGFDNMRFVISNMRITPDVNGEIATAVFDKEWAFSGPGKSDSGKVLSQFLFKKINGHWLIAGEKDLKTYYVYR